MNKTERNWRAEYVEYLKNDASLTEEDRATALRLYDRDCGTNPAEQPEEERERFEVALKKYCDTHMTGAFGLVRRLFADGWQAAKRDALTQAPQERAAPQQMSDLISGIRTINRSKQHQVKIGEDDPCYWQRGEWVKWILELADEAERALLSLAQSSEGKKP